MTRTDDRQPGEMENYDDFCHMTKPGMDGKAKIIASHLGRNIRSRLPDR